MKYLLLALLAAALLWVVSIAWANRHKPATGKHDSSGGSDSGGCDSGDSYSPSCGSNDGGCGGGDGGGGGGGD